MAGPGRARFLVGGLLPTSSLPSGGMGEPPRTAPLVDGEGLVRPGYRGGSVDPVPVGPGAGGGGPIRNQLLGSKRRDPDPNKNSLVRSK